VAEEPFDPSAHVGEAVTFRGTALTAAAGAIVSTGRGRPIYVGGLERWDKELEHQRVEVSGVLRRQESTLPPPGETPSHGVDAAAFVLDDARWGPAPG
jgi:hypothetical protein